MKAAVLDLGTNTFQLGLYLVEPGPHLIMIEEDEVFVTLSKESGQQLSSAAAKRARQAIKHFIHQIDAYNPDLVLAVGTAAFRQLSGAAALQQELESLLTHPIRIASGEEEARWTSLGVTHAITAGKDYLHMDIGGGSTEFTLVAAGEVQHAISLPIGAATLASRFSAFDVLTQENATAASTWLQDQLAPVWSTMGTTHPLLVGTSGSFEAILELQQPGKRFGEICGDQLSATLSTGAIQEVIKPLLASSLAERLQWPGLHPKRAPYFLMAAFLMETVVTQAQVKQLTVARYGLREGYLLTHLAT